jgi:hypothetical protein
MRFALRYRDHDLELTQGEFIIGRASSCQLSLDDPLVSRNHARLMVAADSVHLEDLGSRNGVKVNGERIQGSRALQHGDEIVIGGQEMVLRLRRDVSADTLIQGPTPRSSQFGVLGVLADKALGLGLGDEAERLVGQLLDQLLAEIEGGRTVTNENLERAADLAVRLAGATGNCRWCDYVFRAYTALRRPCPLPLVDQLHTVMRRVRQPSTSALRTYVDVLRELDLGPAERFLLSRLEGLERSIGAR